MKPRFRSARVAAAAAVILWGVGVPTSPGATAAPTDLGVPCSGPAALIAAVTQANAQAGATIDLAAGCMYTLSAVDNYWYGPDGLPAIASTITIEGNGATIARTADAPPFRFFYVGADPANPNTLGYTSPGAGNLTLHNLTLTGGLAKGGDGGGGGGAGLGGAIFNQGGLTLDAVTASANTARGGTAAIGSGGGGIGTNADAEDNGGGFGPGTFGGSAGGLVGTTPDAPGGGGGGGFVASENGAPASAAGAGGGPDTGLGGMGAGQTGPGDGSGSGGGIGDLGPGGAGGGFGSGGAASLIFGGAGGGGVGGGGGGFGEGGGGGFGGGGGTDGSGGFGGGGGARAGFGGVGRDGAGMGGVVFNHQGTVTVLNSTLADNTAAGGSTGAGDRGKGLGGALFNLNGTMTVTNATIDANQVTGGTGGGIYNLSLDLARARTATVSLDNSVVAGNGVSDLVDNQNIGTGTATVDESRFDIVTSQTNDMGTITGTPSTANPQLGALAANGGPGMLTQAPASSSPAIGQVPEASCPTTDERGLFRPASGATACDIGAFELGGTTTAITTTTTTTTAPTTTTTTVPGLPLTGRSDGIANLWAAGLLVAALAILGVRRRGYLR